MNANTTAFASALCAAACGAAAFAADMPDVTAVTMTQADSREVTIAYTLENAPAVVTLDIQTNATDGSWASIGGENIQVLSGDVNRRVATSGAHEIKWRPDLSWPDHKVVGDGVRAVVTAWPMDNPPDYMVVDISAGAVAGDVEWYPNAGSVPGGVTNNVCYRQTTILMRKIMAKGVTYTAGSFGEYTATPIREKTHPADLTNNFYIGVFEVTQAQWALIFERRPWPSYFTYVGDRAMRPVERVSYNEIRCGTTNLQTQVQGGEWPDPPYEQSYLGLLRTKTGIDFDLPSEAQWEYACRAGNGDGRWGNGEPIRSNNVPGRYNGNGGSSSDAASVTAEKGTAIAGSYAPNDWGIYDMHGNIQEWCVDYYLEDISGLRGVVNTIPTAKHEHTYRGGTFVGGYSNARSAFRSYHTAESSANHIGFRLVCPVEFE
ncbi:MAG: formylglycine-generating enzyme family protein [Kiritimatiellae bacterium]|nr:formylglycine-generating enzyme family protein [Kiritimatiellia bacterium]